MDCPEVLGFIDDYYDEVISDDLHIEIDKHLGTCYNCNSVYKEMNNYFQQLKDFSHLLDKPTTLQEDIFHELTGETKEPVEEVKPKKNPFKFFKRS